MKPTKLILLSLLLSTGFSSFVNYPAEIPIHQNNNKKISQELFSYLRCHRQAKNIVVNWGTTSVTGVDHFEIYHSDNNDFFDLLSTIPVSSGLKYTYKHENVFPGYHYYYIKAVMSNGTWANSVVDVVRIVSHG